ncbi:MAG: FkbM family methyltransferase [Paracoccaceae bacterium]|nr:FkbM family methyltransferase [Paracoccaceae bacterium]
MSDPFRNLRLYYHRFLKTKIRKLDGVRVATDNTIPNFVRSVIYKGTYEGAERELLKGVIRAGDTVLEVGAGIGFMGLMAARLAAPGRVVSFEANPNLKDVIEKNYSLNENQPELRMQAMTVDGASVTFNASPNLISSSLYSRDAKQVSVTVDSAAIEAVFSELQPDIMVMHVEGAEVDLLANGDLASARALLIELHPHIVGQGRISELLTSLEGRGFIQTAQLQNNVLLTRHGK